MKNKKITPDHYKKYEKEVWEMMIDIWGHEKFTFFCEINAFKYRMRAGMKDNKSIEEDIHKAQWYEDKVKAFKENIARSFICTWVYRERENKEICYDTQKIAAVTEDEAFNIMNKITDIDTKKYEILYRLVNLQSNLNKLKP